jgi:hypothetical protein
MKRMFIGAALIVAGIAAFIEASGHAPEYCGFRSEGFRFRCPLSYAESPGGHHLSGLRQTPYDLLRIGAWALVIFGALLVVVGLLAYARAPKAREGDGV